MRWYNPKRWFNLTTGIVLVGIIIFLVFIGTIVVGLSLWNVPLAKQIFPFLEISDVFPTKAIALFTGLATFGTLVLALTTILTIKNNNKREEIRRAEELSKEKRQRDKAELDGVINWAVDILKCGLPVEASAVVNARTMEQTKKYISTCLVTLANHFREIIGKGLFIEKIALAYDKMSSGELSAVVNKASEYLNKQSNLIDKCNEAVLSDNFNEFQRVNKELNHNWEELTNSADTIIGVALNLELVILDI